MYKQWTSCRCTAAWLLSLLITTMVFVIMKDRLAFAAALFSGTISPQPTPLLGNLDIITYNGMPKLHFSSEGTFKISILEDLHFGEAPDLSWGPVADQKSLGVIKTILHTENPDLVVLNGDLITGENTYLHNATHYLDMIAQPLIERNKPWASTYGNHDSQFNLSSQRLLERERSQYPDLSYTRSMISSEDAGVSNYVLPIYSSDTTGDATIPAVLLWFFDSRGGSKYQIEDPNGQTPDERRVPIPDFVHASVADWLVQTNADFIQKYGHAIPSLAFVHIPPYAMAAFQKQGVNPKYEPGINDDDPLAPQCFTSRVYTAQDVPFMKALVDVGVKAVFSGHDHGNDWCFRWNSLLDGMTLAGNGTFACFSRHSGYGGYGSWTRGSRQILLHEATLHEEIASWNRLEDSSISGAVMLNSTYGTDMYPAARSQA